MEYIGDLSPSAILFLITITIVSLMSQVGNGSSALEEFHDKCLILLPGNVCDFVLGKYMSNTSNSTFLSNYSALTYNDKNLGFTIQYSLGWTIDQGDKEFNTVLRFVSAQNDADVDIRIFPKGDYKSIDEYGDTFKQSNNEFKLLNYYRNSSTTLSDRPAVRAIYLTTYNASIVEKTYGNNSFTSKEMMVATMVPEKQSIYAIVYFSNSANFDNYLPVIEKMIDSFKIY
ncbi:MAG TPA: hypothetical protein VIP29_02570 [Nitrososphaeraceae archaeon]